MVLYDDSYRQTLTTSWLKMVLCDDSYRQTLTTGRFRSVYVCDDRLWLGLVHFCAMCQDIVKIVWSVFGRQDTDHRLA